MRPIAYGIIIFFGSGVLWFLFSFWAAIQGVPGEPVTAAPFVYIFGALFMFILPVAIIAEIVQWIRRRRISGRKKPLKETE